MLIVDVRLSINNSVCNNYVNWSDVSIIDGITKSQATFGQGTGTIAIENVACSGSENQLLACPSSTIFGTTCQHSEDAGVVCEGMLYETAVNVAVLNNKIIIMYPCNRTESW